LRISEIVALNIGDVSLSARLGTVKIWHGKGDTTRTVPLHPELRRGIGIWLDERSADSEALFVGRSGKRLSVRSAGAVVVKIGELAAISDLTPHVLRHTFATNLTRGGTDLVIVAELCGHRRLETTRRYSLPTDADRLRAVEMLPVEG
jgi:integrase/recombinase XerC